MRLTVRRFLVAAGAILPALVPSTALFFHGVEGWKLWYEMSAFHLLGVMVWLWVAAYMFAAIVLTFELDDEASLKWWEFLIDAGNTVTSLILAFKCAHQAFNDQFPFALRLSLWLIVCFLAQFTVMFVAHRARRVGRRLRNQMKEQSATRAINSAPDSARITLATDTSDSKKSRKNFDGLAAASGAVLLGDHGPSESITLDRASQLRFEPTNNAARPLPAEARSARNKRAAAMEQTTQIDAERTASAVVQPDALKEQCKERTVVERANDKHAILA